MIHLQYIVCTVQAYKTQICTLEIYIFVRVSTLHTQLCGKDRLGFYSTVCRDEKTITPSLHNGFILYSTILPCH